MDLAAALLSTGDVSGYTGTPKSEAGSPLPCTPSAPALQTTYKPLQKGDVEFDNASKSIAFDESILVYSPTVAAQFITTATKGFACATGDFGGTKGKIVPVATSPGGAVDAVKRWDIAFADGTLGTAIVAREGGYVVGLSFQATKADATQLNPADVLTKALAKLDAAS